VGPNIIGMSGRQCWPRPESGAPLVSLRAAVCRSVLQCVAVCCGGNSCNAELLREWWLACYTHGGALDSSNYQHVDFGCNLLVLLTEEISDWDQK